MITRRQLLGAAVLTGGWLAAGMATSGCGAHPPISVTSGGCGSSRIGDELTGFVRDLAVRGEFSGAVLLEHRGCTVFGAACGMANQAASVPNMLTTRFTTASVGKFFTGVTAAKLVQDQRLRFDNTLGEVVPQLRNPALRPLTLHQLLTHTAALPKGSPRSAENPTGSALDYLPTLERLELIGRPGEKWSYSNSGFVAAAMMIENAGGRPYVAAVRDHVFTPAQMHDTITLEPGEQAEGLAVRHTPDGHTAPNASTTGAGGFYTTVGDLAAFARTLTERTLLDERHTLEVITGKVRAGRGGMYSYGCSEKTMDGHRIVGHNGGSRGASAQLCIYLDDGYTLAVLCNVHQPHETPSVRPIVNKIHQLIIDA